jgi:GNAT superfamily N-acetyltransferase
MDAAASVRPLQPADLEPLRWVIYRAYLEVLVQLYGPEAAAGYEVRSTDFMELYVRRDRQGCFVAQTPEGTPAGAVFCFVWGRVGWFGSLAVAPEWQGRGLGQALTQRALEYLRQRECRRIGLETWPHSPLVRHLYGKFGFRPVRPTVKFSRPVALPSSPETAGEADEAASGVDWAGAGARQNPRGVLDAVTEVTREQALARPEEPEVDYRLEAAVPLEAGWADLGVARDGSGRPQGYALCYVRRPGGGPVAALDVRLLGVSPGARAGAVLERLLAACDQRARAAGAPSVTVDVNLRHATAAAILRELRFRPVYELLRMEYPLPGFDPAARTPLIDCARWAG